MNMVFTRPRISTETTVWITNVLQSCVSNPFNRRCVSAVVSLPLAHGQTNPGLDAYYPGMNAGADAVDIPASASNSFMFEIHSTETSSAGANPQPLQTYTRGFPAVGCNVNGIWNISFAQLFTPEQSTDYAVHLSNRIPFPNNVTGESWTLGPNAAFGSYIRHSIKNFLTVSAFPSSS